MKRYEQIEHTADIGVKVYGRDLKELFKSKGKRVTAGKDQPDMFQAVSEYMAQVALELRRSRIGPMGAVPADLEDETRRNVLWRELLRKMDSARQDAIDDYAQREAERDADKIVKGAMRMPPEKLRRVVVSRLGIW